MNHAVTARIEKKKRARSCAKKRRYRDAESARGALRRLARRSDRMVKPVRVYGPCAFCKGYHLTSQELR